MEPLNPTHSESPPISREWTCQAIQTPAEKTDEIRENAVKAQLVKAEE